MEIALLLLSVLIGGMIPFVYKAKEINYRYLLTFSGAYLLCITVVHMLPELFYEADSSLIVISSFLLGGFFLQKVLELFSGGVEHGHVHVHSSFSPIVLVLSLCLHAFLEGTALSSVGHHHNHDHHGGHLLYGIILHKIPAAFALSSLLMAQGIKKRKHITYLIIFALASPLGLFSINLLSDVLHGSITEYLFAIVTGNLLHIATTIFFESSPEHRLDKKKWFFLLLGVGLALVAEFFG
ncbi:MAG: ZIP family metal transporter [Cyclobacteriaceae bacterium]